MARYTLRLKRNSPAKGVKMSLLAKIRKDPAGVAAAAGAKLRERLVANSAGCPSNVAELAAERRDTPPIAASAAGLAAMPGSNLEHVEIVDEWILPDDDWLPRFFRGLPVVQVLGPVPFHGGRSGSVAARAAASAASTSTVAPADQATPPAPPTVAAAPCPTCSNDPASDLGGFLFWEQVGPARNVRCVECSPPPMRKLVADLWLVEWDEAARDGAGCERWLCASENDRWKRVAFAHLAAAEQKQRESSAASVKLDNEGF